MNFFGILGQLGRLLPGYAEGRRQAIQDNWQDLSNYNSVYKGQLQNAFGASTLEPQINNIWNASHIGELAARQAVGQYGLYRQAYPTLYQNAPTNAALQQQLSQFLPQILPYLFGFGRPAQPEQPAQPTSSTLVDPRQELTR